VQTSDLVCVGFLLYAKAKRTELLVSVAPSLGDGGLNVIVGALLGTVLIGGVPLAADVNPPSTTAKAITSNTIPALDRTRPCISDLI